MEILVVLLTLVKFVASSNPNCHGGALFLSLADSQTYKRDFTFDCTDANLQQKLDHLKRRTEDPYVSYFIKNNGVKGGGGGGKRGRVVVKRDMLEGSGDDNHHGDDYEDEDDDDEDLDDLEEDGDNHDHDNHHEEIIEPSEPSLEPSEIIEVPEALGNVPPEEDIIQESEVEVKVSSKFGIPVEPTPTPSLPPMLESSSFTLKVPLSSGTSSGSTTPRSSESDDDDGDDQGNINIVPTATSTSSTAMSTSTASIISGSPSHHVHPPSSPTPHYSSSVVVISPQQVYIGSGDYYPVITTPLPTLESNQPTYPTTPTIPAKRLQKQLLHAGVKHEQVLQDSNCVQETKPKLPWITIVPQGPSTNATRILALPSNEEVSEWEFEVKCDLHVYEVFYSVRQRQKSRNWSHLYRIEFGTMRRDLERFLRFLEEVKGANKAAEDLVVVKYNLEEFPFFVEFVNETIVSEGMALGSCPKSSLKQTLGFLQSRLLNRTLSNTYKPTKVTLSPYKTSHTTCDKEDIISIITSGGDGGGGPGTLTTTPSPAMNYPPSIKNQIDKIEGIVGYFLLYKIPPDFCYDPEDGEANKLKLSLKNLKTFESFGDDFWMQFDNKNQEIYGLPMSTQELDAVLVCEDKGGRSAHDSLQILILPSPTTKYSAEFSLHFDSIPWKPKAIRKFIEKLSTLLSPQIEVKTYSEANGHLQFKWYNTSNPKTEFEVNEIRKILFSDEGGVNKRVKQSFAPEFNLSDSGGVLPIGGVLLAGQTPIENSNMGENPNQPKGGSNTGDLFDFDKKSVFVEEGPPGQGGQGFDDREDFGDNWLVELQKGTYLTTYIIPSVLITVMILLALIIACLLSRKKREDFPDEFVEEKKNFLKVGGVPVIFQEELEQQELVNRQRQKQIQQQQQQQQHHSHHPQHQQPHPLHHVAVAPTMASAPPPRYDQSNSSLQRGIAARSSGTYHPPPSYHPPSTSSQQSSLHHPQHHHNPQHQMQQQRNPPSYPDPYSSPSSSSNHHHHHLNQAQLPPQSYQPPPALNYYGGGGGNRSYGPSSGGGHPGGIPTAQQQRGGSGGGMMRSGSSGMGNMGIIGGQTYVPP